MARKSTVRMSLENNLFEIYWCCFVDFCLSVRYWGSCHLIETPYLLHCTALFRSCCQCSNRQCVRFVIDWLSLNCFRCNDASLQWARGRGTVGQGVRRVGEIMKKREDNMEDIIFSPCCVVGRLWVIWISKIRYFLVSGYFYCFWI